jgi:hypothetical protein
MQTLKTQRLRAFSIPGRLSGNQKMAFVSRRIRFGPIVDKGRGERSNWDYQTSCCNRTDDGRARRQLSAREGHGTSMAQPGIATSKRPYLGVSHAWRLATSS